jgi:hypothetical protein
VPAHGGGCSLAVRRRRHDVNAFCGQEARDRIENRRMVVGENTRDHAHVIVQIQRRDDPRSVVAAITRIGEGRSCAKAARNAAGETWPPSSDFPVGRSTLSAEGQ